jgi:hypothetical protein
VSTDVTWESATGQSGQAKSPEFLALPYAYGYGSKRGFVERSGGSTSGRGGEITKESTLSLVVRIWEAGHEEQVAGISGRCGSGPERD